MNIPSRTNEVQIPNKRAEPADDGEPVERKQPKWKQVPASRGTRPSPRSGHSAVVGSHAMYIFGGRDGNTFKSDVFSFDFASRTWTEVATTGARPQPRYGHKAVYYHNKMAVFGGHGANAYLNDLHILDLETNEWEKIEPEGQPPSPRWQHSLVVFRGLMIVFGGCDTSSYLNDLHSFDFERNLWQSILVDDYSIPPAPRMMHGAIVCDERMLVFGGQCVDSIRNDFFEFNFELNTWNFIGVAEGRFRRNFACLEIAGSFLLIGGYSVGLHNDVLRFDFDTGSWATVDIQGKAPSPRSGHTAVVYEERIYIFGGVSNDGAQNDMHVLSLGYLNEETVSSSLPRVGSFNDHELHANSPLDSFMGTSPLEGNFLHRFRNASSVGEVLTPHNKDESPLIMILREEMQKLKSELEECKKENFELKRELSLLKAEKTDDNSFLLY
eukprot:Phypoly_transcript_06713.p1 GENE.Phypoly_transcript_06713~~Phypoly_transcript_06713.p1  ORF type:complete len:440 (+),score=56.17 Phypoly_transcript_06713:298-1617(+)